MSFEPSKKLKTILDMINEFVARELIPMEHDFYEKGFNAMEPEIEKKREMVRQMELWAPLHPEEFNYMFSIYDAEEAFMALDFSVCFVGHTHVPLVYNHKGGPKGLKPGEPLELDPSDRYIINPGSVGQPRDGDNRASFLVYDPDERTVTLQRAEYDIEAEAKDILEAGLPGRFADRLFRGR